MPAPDPFVSDAPGGEEVPVVAWPLLFRHKVSHRVRSSDRYPWWVLVTVLAGLFATGFTITIMAVSLKDIAKDLGSSETALTWVVTGPFLALALTMPLFGKLGDLYGHRRVYLLGFAGFTVGAALTAFAWSGGSLIAIRVLGSIPGAATGPTSMALIMRAFPEDDRVKAMGWWALVGAGAPVIGLVAGGPLVDAVGWRWIFVAQVPISLVALVVGFLVLHETPRREKVPIDVAGAATLGVAVVAALLGMTLGAQLGWGHPAVIGLLVLSPVALWLFVRTERSAAEPLLPLDFFRHRDFTASLVAQGTSNFAYMGGFIITPLLMENRFGFSVAATSLKMVCRPLSNSLASPSGGYLAARIGERPTAIAGMLMIAVSMVMFAFAASAAVVALVFVGLVLSGIGLGGSAPSLITVVANTVDAEDLGVANAAQQMVAMIGTVAGIQVLSTIQGGSESAGPFTAAYLVGGAIAVVGVVASSFVRSSRPSTASMSAAEAG
jgi:EmrB/QacA subfamily drug resistance transporter